MGRRGRRERPPPAAPLAPLFSGIFRGTRLECYKSLPLCLPMFLSSGKTTQTNKNHKPMTCWKWLRGRRGCRVPRVSPRSHSGGPWRGGGEREERARSHGFPFSVVPFRFLSGLFKCRPLAASSFLCEMPIFGHHAALF